MMNWFQLIYLLNNTQVQFIKLIIWIYKSRCRIDKWQQENTKARIINSGLRCPLKYLFLIMKTISIYSNFTSTISPISIHSSHKINLNTKIMHQEVKTIQISKSKLTGGANNMDICRLWKPQCKTIILRTNVKGVC